MGFPLGLTDSDFSSFPFDFWYRELPHEVSKSIRSREFEDKIASFLIAGLISEINETPSTDKDKLATLILGIQLISTNLSFSSRYGYKEKKDDLKTQIIEKPDSTYLYLSRKREDEINQTLSDFGILINEDNPEFISAKQQLAFNFWNLFANHEQAYRSGIEAWKAIPANLAEAFKNLFIKHNGQAFKLNIVNNTEVEKLLKNSIVKFNVRYVNGLINVALEMIKGKANGVLYLFDHIIRVLGNHGLMPKEGEDLSAEQWQERLLEVLDYNDLFDFSAKDNKVREIGGRYDERALLDELRERQAISITELGFGHLGVSFYQLIKKLDNLGIRVTVNQAVDLADFSSVSKDPNSYSVEQYLRGEDGVYQHAQSQDYPDSRILSESEVEEIIKWREGLLKEGKLIGKTDLTETQLEITPQPSDLVTIRGTVACVGDLKKRWQMIRNALDFVNPNGGIFLVEGGMTLLGGQNVGSIAIRLNNDQKAEVLYINFSRRKKDKNTTGYKAGQQTLVANREKRRQIGRNYYGLSFSNPQALTEKIYKSIKELKEKKGLDMLAVGLLSEVISNFSINYRVKLLDFYIKKVLSVNTNYNFSDNEISYLEEIFDLDRDSIRRRIYYFRLKKAFQ